MPVIDFPESPAIGDIYPIGAERQWRWTGDVWQTVTTQIGSQGDKGGLRYNFDTATTMSEPDSGKIKFNNSTISSVSSIAINALTIEEADVSNYLVALSSSLVDELSEIKYYMVISGNINNSSTYAIFGIKDVTDNSSWLELEAEYLSGTLPANNEPLIISLSRIGDQGPTGPETSLTVGTVETSLPGETGAVSITGPAGNQVISFIVPQGPTGPETSISIGDVATANPGGNAQAYITGPAGDQVLSLVIPQGPTGPTGPLDLPSYTGNAGKYLTTNGTDVLWATVDALPSQTDNAGKYLFTNGTVATWELLVALPDQAGNSGELLTTNGTAASWSNTLNANSVSTIGLIVKGLASQTANLQEWQNSAGTRLASVSSSGAFSAITKSFDIEHPNKENMRLRYASLEGPENGVYIRGKIQGNVIELPDYWTGLVDERTITVSLTPIGKPQELFVEDIRDNKVFVSGLDINAFFTVFAERKDVDKLVVEYDSLV
jgi:hypothetical protein